MNVGNLTALHSLIPKYAFRHVYCTIVKSGDLERVFSIARDAPLSNSKYITALFSLRGLPPASQGGKAFIESMGWTELLNNAPTEFVIGYIEDGDVESREQFSEACASRKVAFSFRFSKIDSETVQVVSETRVECHNRVETVKFWFYWILIRPFSGLIRKEILRIVRVQAETEWASLRAHLEN